MIGIKLQPTTSLYIGTKNVYVAQIKGTLLGAQLDKFGQVQIPAPASAQKPESAQQRSEVLVEAIGKVMRENNITSKKVVTALPGKDVLIRYFQMPQIPRSEWETAIKFESKKYIPFRIEELMWDFQVVLPKGKGSNRMNVTFAAVKKDVAKDYLELFAEAGLQVQALEPAPFSLMRVLAATKQLTKNKPTAIVDFDQGMADINIVKDRICFLTRDVSLPLEEEIVFENLLNEIRMSLDYYEKLFPSELVTKIVLSGDLERKDWDRKLEAELKVKTEKVNLSKALNLKSAALPLNMAVAVGLGLRGAVRDAAQINLCRQPSQVAKVRIHREVLQFTQEVRQAMVRAVIFSAAGLLILYLAMYRTVALEHKQLQEVISLRPELSLPVDKLSYADLKKMQGELTQKLHALTAIMGPDNLWTSILNELPKIVFPEVWLTSLSFSGDSSKGNKIKRSFKLRGLAYHEDPVQGVGVITKFTSALKENKEFSRGFEQIELLSMTSAKIGEIQVKQFTVVCEN
ncbi:pilus assembly protein PilM [Candidatus Omnitrophota bacterium]